MKHKRLRSLVPVDGYKLSRWRWQIQYAIRRLFPSYAYRLKKWRWESRWSRPNYIPAWGNTTDWIELREAIDSQWFQPGSAVLDIGCGSGDIAAWLAERGYSVVGVDYARGAIEKASLRWPEFKERLVFRLLDICNEVPGPGKFQVLIDRGCFHNIPKAFAPKYAENVARSAVPGARFLLVMPVTNQPEADPRRKEQLASQAKQYLSATFQPLFDILRIEDSQLDKGSGNSAEKTIPALACWMVRR